MNRNAPWDRLVAAARRAPEEGDVSAPYGFAVRVAALAMASRRRPVPMFGEISVRSSLRALGVACLLAAVTVGVGYPALAKVFSAPVAPAPMAPAAVQTAVPEAAPATQGTPSTGAAPSDDPVSDVVDLMS